MPEAPLDIYMPIKHLLNKLKYDDIMQVLTFKHTDRPEINASSALPRRLISFNYLGQCSDMSGHCGAQA